MSKSFPKLPAPFVTKEVAARQLKSLAPDWEWVLARIESDKGWLRFPPQLQQRITDLKLENYPQLYENELALNTCLARGFIEPDELQAISKELDESTVEDRNGLIRQLIEFTESAEFESLLLKTPQEIEAARLYFLALPLDEQKSLVRKQQHVFAGFFSLFYQCLSIMVHGEKLTALVSQAKQGDDQAFVKAIQIDTRILTAIPYFSQRLARARAEGDQDFCDLISYRLKCAPFVGKIRYKSLWMTFAMLDWMELLDRLTHPEILAICDDAGLGAYKNRIEDVKHLSRRIAEYRAFQKRSQGTTTSK